MHKHKTGAWIRASVKLGLLASGSEDDDLDQRLERYATCIGLAFQVQDDILGIWGDENVTGKSAASDLVEGKNSLPILFGIGKKSKFSNRWSEGPLRAEEVAEFAAELEREGARSFAEHTAREQTDKALMFLEEANSGGEAGAALLELANKLLGRAN